ncbi:MAG: hypothetical protein ACRCY4_09910 [Brevinema sp.]
MKKYMLVVLPFLFGACAVKSLSSDSVDAAMFKSVAPARANNFNTPFLQEIAGSYTNVEGTEFRVSSSGSFVLDNITYTLHEVLSETSAIFKAETPLPDRSNQKMITYHGIILQDTTLWSAGIKKELDFSKSPKLTAQDTPYAGVLNAQRIENLDFDLAKATRFAAKTE